MSFWFIVVLQAASPTNLETFDLLKSVKTRGSNDLSIIERCKDDEQSGEIVVCGRKQEYRLPLPIESKVASEPSAAKRLDAMNTGRAGACSTAGSAGVANCSVEEWAKIKGGR